MKNFNLIILLAVALVASFGCQQEQKAVECYENYVYKQVFVKTNVKGLTLPIQITFGVAGDCKETAIVENNKVFMPEHYERLDARIQGISGVDAAYSFDGDTLELFFSNNVSNTGNAGVLVLNRLKINDSVDVRNVQIVSTNRNRSDNFEFKSYDPSSVIGKTIEVGTKILPQEVKVSYTFIGEKGFLEDGLILRKKIKTPACCVEGINYYIID